MNAIIILLFLAFLVYLFEKGHHDYIFGAVLVFFMIFPLINDSGLEKEVKSLTKEIQKKDQEIKELRSLIKVDTSLENTQTSTKVTVEKQEPVVGKEDWEKSKSW